MSVRRIVFSFDGSETSLKALPWAIRFAKESGAATVLLSVFEPLAQYPIGKAANLLQFEMSAKQYLEDLQNEAKEAFLKACGRGLSGFPLAEISALRKESGAPYLHLSGSAASFCPRAKCSAGVMRRSTLS